MPAYPRINPGNELAAAKRAYRPRSPVESAIALAPPPRDRPGFQTQPAPVSGDLRSAFVSSLTQASQSHSGDLTQALGLIRQMREQKTAAAAPAPAAPKPSPTLELPNPAGPPITVQVHGQMTPKDRRAISVARQFLGTPYHWGGSNPSTGFDCSGLLQYAWGRVGVQIPRTTYDQYRAGKPVSLGQLRPGDAVFFEPSGRGPGHVAMYVGGGKILEAPHTGANVRIVPLRGRNDVVGARRFG